MLLDPINVSDAISAAERELYEMQFHLVSRNRRGKDLDKLATIQLFRAHAPEISSQELKFILDHFESRGTFQMNVNEYIQIKAAKKMELERTDEEDLKRHFTVLDYHGNGSLVANEITEALEKTRDPGVEVLKQAIQNATKLSEDGTITFELFRRAIHEMNRQNQAMIAANTMRLYRLEAKLQDVATKRMVSATQQSSLQAEYDILHAQNERQKNELITVQNDLFSKVYGIIVAQYMCETSVLQAFKFFFSLLHTEDSHLFRRNLEKSGRVVTVHPSFLLYPGPEIERSKEFAQLCDFMVTDVVYDSDNNGPIFTNRAFRKIFIWYCLLGSLTNFQTISRTNFLRFAHDCRLAQLSDRPILDADIDACFVLATTREHHLKSPVKPVDSESFHFHFRPIPELFDHVAQSQLSPSTPQVGGMNFKQWVHGTTLLLCKCLGLEELPSGDTQDELFREYILPHGHQLKTQPLGPEVSQPQVMEFIRKHVWPLKQLFSHFAGHSMTSIELNRGLSLRDFILLVRCFDILPSSLIEMPVTKPGFRQLSLQEVVQEYNAAKLDVGFAKTESRESLDLNFHEFLRCIQRLALAMNRSSPGAVRESTKHMTLVSSFQHFRNDMESQGKAQVHLFKHTRQLHAEDRHMSKVVALVRTRLTSQASLLQATQLFHRQTETALYDHLPPLAMDNVIVPSTPPLTTSRTSSIASNTKKCTSPKPTHLPLAGSPRYSAHRPFSLGGSPRIKTIRPAPQLDFSFDAPPPSNVVASPKTKKLTGAYKDFVVPPMSSRERSRTPYEQDIGVVKKTHII